MRRLFVLACCVVLSVSVLGGCSSSKSASAPADCTVVGSSYTLVAKNISWSTSCLSTTGGKAVTFTIDNQDDGIQHNFAVFGNGAARQGTKLEAGPNKQTLAVTLTKPGHYTFVCDLHQNMEGDYYVK